MWGNIKYFQNLLNNSQSISYDEQSDMKVPVEPCTSMNDLDPTELDREISIEEVEAAIHLKAHLHGSNLRTLEC